MATSIESAGVQKNGAIVDSEGRIAAFATSEAEDRHENKKDGTTWSIDIPAVTPAGVNDYFFYFENTGSDIYIITDVRLIGGAATLIDVDKVSGTPTYVTGTDITPLSRNTGKIPTVSAILKYDTDITGLNDLGRYFPIQIQAASILAHLRTSSGIVVEPGGQIALKSSVATSLQGTVSIYKPN